MHGYKWKILEIDLTEASFQSRSLSSRIAQNYLGGRGLATRRFVDEVDPLCDPLGPENVLVIATSPLLGTKAPTACRGHMVFKSPLTGVIGSTNCGGSWAPVFKAAGYDALVIKGKAEKPVFLDIKPGSVSLQPAQDLWGLDVHATTDRLAASDSQDQTTRILCIGPAGENQVRFAAVMNDKNRAYGRSGSGAVFGSKNLKAIRVAGRERSGIHNPELYQSGLDQARYLMKAAPITKRLLHELGTAGLLELIDIMDMLPRHNFQSNRHVDRDLDRISGETIRKTILTRAKGCYACPIGCQRHTRIGDWEGEGPEFESVVLMGPQCGIYDMEAITRTNYRCNELGMDTISFGGTLACAMELSERDILTAQDTDRRDLRFGRPAILEEMVEEVAFRKGFGNRLAEGSLRLAEHFGHPEFSMTVKKLEIPAYDPRASYTQALGYMTSPTGACHLRGGYAVSLAFFGGTREIPRFSLLQSPIAIRNMQNLGIIQDSLGICRFTGFAFSTDPWSRMLTGLTGYSFSTAALEEIAERIATLERSFNLKAGATSADDTLPRRFMDETIPVGDLAIYIPQTTIARMKKDYYQVRGWDAHGVPRSETLARLQVEEL
ncbi:MAG: aldehyde ferredoxin oxidoreductase [Candidatus Aminicenantes bacterium]|nr:aldehyde ferredoxin oxidoreductase [Candidatus Aminicenantes bacterium]